MRRSRSGLVWLVVVGGLVAGLATTAPEATASPPASRCGCTVSLSAHVGHRGDSITVTGKGFIPGTKAQIAFFGSGGRRFVLASSVLVGANGDFSRLVTIPRTAGAGHGRIHAMARRLGAASPFMVLVSCPSKATTSHPASGMPGGALEIHGTGWCAGTQVFVRFSGPGGRTTVLAGPLRVGPSKAFDVETTVPLGTKPGPAHIRVSDPASGQRVNSAFEVVAS